MGRRSTRRRPSPRSTSAPPPSACAASGWTARTSRRSTRPPAALLREAREERRPAVLEALTYRYRGHSVADPGTAYRSPDEIEEWRRRDPIALFGARLRERGIFSSDDELERGAAARRAARRGGGRVRRAQRAAARRRRSPGTSTATPTTAEQFARMGPGSPFGERELVLEGGLAVPEATIAPPPPGPHAADGTRRR